MKRRNRNIIIFFIIFSIIPLGSIFMSVWSFYNLPPIAMAPNILLTSLICVNFFFMFKKEYKAILKDEKQVGENDN